MRCRPLGVARFLVISCVFLAACSSRQTTNPAAPSSTATSATPAPATGSVTIAGTVIGMSSTSGWRVQSAGMTVTVMGTSTSAGVDGNGNFRLVNVPAGHVDLHFLGTGADAHLILDGLVENQTLTISVRVSGSSASIEDDHNGGDAGSQADTELEGLVTAVGTSTLTVSGRLVNVTAMTVIVHGSTTVALASIHVGDRVHVKGTAASNVSATGPINATKIEVQNPADKQPDDDQNEDNNQVELKGTIAAGSLAGSCATNSLGFKIGTTSIKTNAATQFKDATCAALKAGDQVEVKGTRQTDASVLASRVERDN
jgi:hypothetical protein